MTAATSGENGLGRRPLAMTAAVLVTSAVMAVCAEMDWRLASAFVAAVVPLAVIGRAVVRGSLAGQTAGRESAAGSNSARFHAGCIVWVLMWGAVALSVGYGLTQLYWQHWWQYALAMALLSAITAATVYGIELTAARLRLLGWLSLAISAAAVTGLGFLVLSGKLQAGKSDWLANQVFLFGGLAVAFVAAVGGMRELRR